MSDQNIAVTAQLDTTRWTAGNRWSIRITMSMGSAKAYYYIGVPYQQSINDWKCFLSQDFPGYMTLMFRDKIGGDSSLGKMLDEESGADMAVFITGAVGDFYSETSIPWSPFAVAMRAVISEAEEKGLHFDCEDND